MASFPILIHFPLGLMSHTHLHRLIPNCDQAGPVIELNTETEVLIIGQEELGTGAHKHCFISKKEESRMCL